MSGPFGQLADELSDLAGAVHAIDTSGLTGTLGEAFITKKNGFQNDLEEFSATLEKLQATADDHRRSESTFVATAPTLDEIEQAAQDLFALQQAAPLTSPLATLPTVLDVANAQAIQDAQLRYNQLSQQRRDAERTFRADQESLTERINDAVVPGLSGRDHDSASVPVPGGSGPSSGGGASVSPGGSPSGGGASGGTPNRAPRSTSSSSDSPSAGSTNSTGSGRTSVEDVLAAGTPVPGTEPSMMPVAGMGMMPQAAMTNPALMNRFGPQIAPGYTIPGTTTSAGQAVPMSNSDFNSLLEKLRSDRATGGASLPTSPSSTPGVGGGGGGGALAGGANAPAAPRLVQPTSWANATSPTGVSEANSRSATASPASSQATSTPARSSAMPPMAPMAPMSPNGAGGSKNPKDQPQIKNADPDVYGDDVRTTDPIIDNKGGRFS